MASVYLRTNEAEPQTRIISTTEEHGWTRIKLPGEHTRLGCAGCASHPAVMRAGLTRTPGPLRHARSFPRGAENSTRGGCAPRAVLRNRVLGRSHGQPRMNTDKNGGFHPAMTRSTGGTADGTLRPAGEMALIIVITFLDDKHSFFAYYFC